MADVMEDIVVGLSQSEIASSSAGMTSGSNVILDSTDPYESLLTGGRAVSDVKSDEGQNGHVEGLLEVAVEAQPDLVFESDLVSSLGEQDSASQSPYIRPRVYLERESFSHQEGDSVSHTANASPKIHNLMTHLSFIFYF